MDNNKKKILEALELCNGIVSSACKSVNMPRSTFYNWLKEDEEFRKAVDEIQEVAIDYVEGKLFEKIEGVSMAKVGMEGESIVYTLPPSDTAIIFFLKTKGKTRGYIEKNETVNKNYNYNSEPLTPDKVKEINNILENDY